MRDVVHILGALAVMSIVAGCGGSSPTAPAAADALTSTTSSAHVDFRFSAGDAVDAGRQEAFHDWVLAQLGVTFTARLRYNKYRDRAHLERMTGQSTNGWADPPAFTVHSIWPWDAHEAVHVYATSWGRPSDFFNEGLAVALSVDPASGRFVSLWNNTDIDEIASNAMRTGSLPGLSGIVETDAFRRVSDQTSYPVAGSFVNRLLQRRGSAAMLIFFRTSSRVDSLATIEARFAAAFGESLSDAESAWRAALVAR